MEIQDPVVQNVVQDVYTFRSIIKSSLLTFSCKLSTIVQFVKTLVFVDSGTNFELSSLQNMPNWLKFEQNTWTRLIFRLKSWTRLIFRLKNMYSIKLSVFLPPPKATSVFLQPLFVFHPKLEFSLEFTQRRLVHQH